jgi:hypothetical protein
MATNINLLSSSFFVHALKRWQQVNKVHCHLLFFWWVANNNKWSRLVVIFFFIVEKVGNMCQSNN